MKLVIGPQALMTALNMNGFSLSLLRLDSSREAALASAGIRVERGVIAELEGGRDGFTGVRLADGVLIPRSGGFVRPQWAVPLGYLERLALDRDTDGYVVVDAWGRTSVPGVYAAGDITPPGPQQLIVAAGNGARVSRALNRDLAGVPG